VGLGNALRQGHDPAIVEALHSAHPGASPLVQEHIDWALAQAGP
jgi:epoxyqueuosine reductase